MTCDFDVLCFINAANTKFNTSHDFCHFDESDTFTVVWWLIFDIWPFRIRATKLIVLWYLYEV